MPRPALPLLLSCLVVPAALRAQLPRPLPNPPRGTPPAPADYDGDRITDVAFKASTGIWYLDVGADGFGGRWDHAYANYGDANAVAVPADYDGDGKADFAVKDASGMWGVDYARDGFGVWNVQVFGYGDASAVPCPADYDGDGKVDLAVKNSAGVWHIDYARDGFGGWNEIRAGYGNASAVPVPADYDGDRRADLSVKDAAGNWYIDYARDGFGAWNEIRSGYGNAAAVPVPADYDNDLRADLSVKDGSGTWLIDYARDGFGSWNASYGGRGATSIPVPGDYDGDGRLDLAVTDADNFWLIDYAADGFAAWNRQIDNRGRVHIDQNAPWIDAVEIWGPSGRIPLVNGQYSVRVGVRYWVALHINPGNGQYTAGVEVNPSLQVPESLNVVNRVGSTGHVRITSPHTRRFAFTPSRPGSFPLGFRMRDIAPPHGTGNPFNPDYGVRLECTAQHRGLYGVTTRRVMTSDGRFVAGPPAADVLVSVGGFSTRTAADGSWRLPGITGGPHTVRFSRLGYHSETIAVNVHVPEGGGVQIDTPMEEPFSTIVAHGMNYRTYIDYSRGRTILHTVVINPAQAGVVLERSPIVSNGGYRTLLGTGMGLGPSVDAMINGGYFNVSGRHASVGYFYSRGYIASEVNWDGTDYLPDGGPGGGADVLSIQPPFMQPLLTVSGIGPGQHIGIVLSEADFFSPTSRQWRQVGLPSEPIWDVDPRDGRSDVDFALQCSPILTHDGVVITRGVYDSGSYYQLAWARTAVGIGRDRLFLVVADGEGINGGNGATFHQLGEFFRDVLGASVAMNFDGGLSSEMVLRGANGLRRVNTITGEDSSWDVDPATAAIQTLDGGPGSVFNYLRVGAN